MQQQHILILGGGFGGTYTAIHLEKQIKKHKLDCIISLVNRENYFVFQPMLAEVVGGSLDVLDTVNPLRKLLPKTQLYVREIDRIDIENKQVILAPKFTHKPYILSYDHLVLSLGNVTDFRGIAGLHEHALPFKNLADSIAIRNQIIDVIEAASYEKDPQLKKELLTFVVGGGGYSGTEVVAEINDLCRTLVKNYPTISQEDIAIYLIHSRDHLMNNELSRSLSEYAANLLQKRGVTILFNTHLASATPTEALLDNGERIKAKTIISTVPSSPNPLIEPLPLELDKGKILTDATLLAKNQTSVWALGDCAKIPNLQAGGFCPPTAQFAIREGKTLSYNIIASILNKPKKEFYFKALGMMGALGHRSAVGEVMGKFKFSGIIAWLLWRAIYWAKLPGLDRKIKVALSWSLDTLFPREAVQLKAHTSSGIGQLHFEQNELIFSQGDVGDYLYIIVKGDVEIIKTHEGKETILAKLGKGEYFGEMALLAQEPRQASVRCLTPVDVLALKKSDFGILIANFAELKKEIEQVQHKRFNDLNN
ncbi:pyridine nucleotide-disulfide oxidoreductase [Candidatus Aerophobetes bacterium]|uniref:Pyridine nucleotide-disulfide oxidoreductase n=1 Tax=Aerophobetes bacterium TaxID=2030807 RepID=A0A2A4X6D7_UNCAE|nr:MAG: pyridine nucleotide-disulfide oxidoreductase [Candidatus Aerophobetes bacterium]